MGGGPAAIEDIIGGNVDKWNPKTSRCCGEPSGAVAIDRKCAFRLRFGHVDSRVCCGIDDRARQHGIHNSVDRIRNLEIEFGAVNGYNGYRLLFPNVY